MMAAFSAVCAAVGITNLSFERHLPVSAHCLDWLHLHFTPKGNIMFNALRTTIIAATLFTGAAHAAVNPNPQFGMAESNASADRQVTINANTKSVNVNNGDTVAFNVNGKTFTWHFDTLHAEEAFSLAKIAPAGIDLGNVTVYVGSNPLYRG
jgi:hypothetical protein